MSVEQRPPGAPGDGEAPSGAARKKPYQKPAFSQERVFETMALACGKVNPTSGACKAVRKNS
jgi:hypothetical protein